jgi:hypothetical protein
LRKLHNEELNDLYSPNTVQAIKSRRKRWAGHAAHMGESRDIYTGFWLGTMGERDNVEDPDEDGRIILRFI